MPVDWNEHDYSPPDFDRENALQDRSHERQTQIALRHFRRPWNCHPEMSEAEPLEPSDAGDMLAASENAEPGEDE